MESDTEFCDAIKFHNKKVEKYLALKRLWYLNQCTIEYYNELIKLSTDNKQLRKYQYFRKQSWYKINRVNKEIKECEKNADTKLVDQIKIKYDDTNMTYESLFGKFLTEDVEIIEIDETYFSQEYQYNNLIAFLELAIRKCKSLKYVKVTTKYDEKSDKESTLQSIKDNLKGYNIYLVFEFSNKLHDRQIRLSNGYNINIGRGIHFFKPMSSKLALGVNDFSYRKCLETKIDIFKNDAISITSPSNES